MSIVELPNGQRLEFPEGMPEGDMRDAIYKNFPEYAPKQEAPAEQNLLQKAGAMAERFVSEPAERMLLDPLRS